MISIIVSSYDVRRLNDIRDLLQSIQAQSEQNYELVYVTERDESLQQAVEEEVRRLGLRAKLVHNRGNSGLAEARNLGARISTGDVLGFVDDDVVLDRGWSGAVESTFRNNPRAVGITGPAHPLWVGEPMQWLPREFDWLIGCTRWFDSNELVPVRNCWGMNMAFRTITFQQVGGFSTETGYHRGRLAEDLDLSLRIQDRSLGALLYTPKMLVLNKVHPYRLSNGFIIERARWIGFSRRQVMRRPKTSGIHRNHESRLIIRLLLSISQPWRNNINTVSSLVRSYRILFLILGSLLIGYAIGPVTPQG